MPLELEVALAYLRSRPSRLVSAVSLLAIVGIALGVAALVVAMGLLSGYRGEIREKLVGANAEIVVYPLSAASTEEVEELRGRLRTVPGVRATAPVVYQTGLAASAAAADGLDVVLKGIDPAAEAEVSPRIAASLAGFGSLESSGGAPALGLGAELARRLDVRPGDSVTLSVPDASPGAAGFLPRTGRFRVAGIFRTNFAEYDSEWIFLDRQALRTLSRMPGSANVVEVGLAPSASGEGAAVSLPGALRSLAGKVGVARALRLPARPDPREELLAAIRRAAGEKFSVADTLTLNEGLFAALQVQQTTLFLVIGLIVAVSTFNVVATLVMTVQEKKRDIGILSSMGAAPSFFSRVFVWLGGLIGGTGVAAGVAFGALVCWAVTTFRLLSFPPGVAEIYFVSFIPFRVRLFDLSLIVLFSAGAILAASWVPARRAARLDVAEALRYE